MTEKYSTAMCYQPGWSLTTGQIDSSPFTVFYSMLDGWIISNGKQIQKEMFTNRILEKRKESFEYYTADIKDSNRFTYLFFF